MKRLKLDAGAIVWKLIFEQENEMCKAITSLMAAQDLDCLL
jgi:hypothetical protein